MIKKLFGVLVLMFIYSSFSLYGENQEPKKEPAPKEKMNTGVEKKDVETKTEKKEPKIESKEQVGKEEKKGVKKVKKVKVKKKIKEEKVSPFVQSYIIDRFVFGFEWGKAMISHDLIEKAEGYTTISMRYLIGDMIFDNPFWEGIFAGLSYSALSAQATKDDVFYRVTRNYLGIEGGISFYLASFSKGNTWKEDILFSASYGIGYVKNNTFNYLESSDKKYSSELDGELLTQLKTSVGYKFFGPWRVNLNIGFEVAGSSSILYGIGLRSGF